MKILIPKEPIMLQCDYHRQIWYSAMYLYQIHQWYNFMRFEVIEMNEWNNVRQMGNNKSWKNFSWWRNVKFWSVSLLHRLRFVLWFPNRLDDSIKDSHFWHVSLIDSDAQLMPNNVLSRYLSVLVIWQGTSLSWISGKFKINHSEQRHDHASSEDNCEALVMINENYQFFLTIHDCPLF
jgi:hypothetical protein